MNSYNFREYVTCISLGWKLKEQEGKEDEYIRVCVCVCINKQCHLDSDNKI